MQQWRCLSHTYTVLLAAKILRWSLIGRPTVSNRLKTEFNDPWGTPAEIGRETCRLGTILTVHREWYSRFQSQMTVGGDTPYDARLEVSTEWSTGLKTFETSRKRTPMTRPASRTLCQSFVVLSGGCGVPGMEH